jgi:parallel beta-helix repeat protein
VVLDFADQIAGDDAMSITAPGFTIEKVWLKNLPGDGIVTHAEDSTFRNIKVSWDAGSVTANGAYAVYPTDCKRMLIEDSEITGASDAGIYVGSCEYAIVRNNKVHANVAGIEIENTLYADVYGNEIYDNTAGIAAALLPNLKIKDNAYVLIRDNLVYDNNRPNFAIQGSIVASFPVGIGLLVLGGHDIEVRDNEIIDHENTGVLIVSLPIFEILTGTTLSDPEIDPFVRDVYVHDNTFTGNGTAPKGALLVIAQPSLENILWDGILNEAGDDAGICLGDNPASFRNFNVNGNFQDQSTDTTPHTCTRDPLPEMETFE